MRRDFEGREIESKGKKKVTNNNNNNNNNNKRGKQSV